ncbi:hypothetical protein FOMPIDRAFT_63389, partial [Fomitopsis schrenkii]
GSIYLLMIIATRSQRWNLARSEGNLATEVGNLLRWPDELAAGQAVTETIIPLVSLLARSCPVNLGQIMPVWIFQGLHAPLETSCCDLVVSDHLFGQILFK